MPAHSWGLVTSLANWVRLAVVQDAAPDWEVSVGVSTKEVEIELSG